MFDNNKGASRCFGFVTFDNKETVDLLVRDNNYSIKGKPIDVKQALPKALQKAQYIFLIKVKRNITCQSGVDLVLNKGKAFKSQGNSSSSRLNEYGEEIDEAKMFEYGNSK